MTPWDWRHQAVPINWQLLQSSTFHFKFSLLYKTQMWFLAVMGQSIEKINGHKDLSEADTFGLTWVYCATHLASIEIHGNKKMLCMLQVQEEKHPYRFIYIQVLATNKNNKLLITQIRVPINLLTSEMPCGGIRFYS